MNMAQIYCFVFLGLIWVAIGVVYLVFRSSRQRRAVRRMREAREFAAQYKFAFYATLPIDWRKKLSGFRLGGSFTNVISNTTDSYSFLIFDNQKKKTYGAADEHPPFSFLLDPEISQTVVLIESKYLVIPDFKLWPGFLFGPGNDDIKFENHPLFSRKFKLGGNDESEIRQFFDLGLLDFFYDRQGISVYGTHGKFIFYRYRHLERISDIKELVDEAFAIYSAFIHRSNRPTPNYI